MRLLVVTGAGASHNLNTPDSDPVVLMEGWASALRERFGPGLSRLMGLDRASSGQEFEELLGELTRWLQLKELNMRFSPMTSGSDQGQDDQVLHYQRALEQAAARGEQLERALDETLFEQFGPHRFDPEAASRAYGSVLAAAENPNDPVELICATTNYDRSLELALRGFHGYPRTGFQFDPIARAQLSTAGLGSFGDQPSILYLHGAVGWYHDPMDGTVVAYPAADRYRPDVGRPAVLYPSKNKIVEESTVAGIWDEFDAAIDSATHVFVIGHGLGEIISWRD